jgi:Protein of unknown function (DUF5818)
MYETDFPLTGGIRNTVHPYGGSCSICGTDNTHTSNASAAEAETFMGTILKDGENYVLSDPAAKSRYTLDDAKKARPYEGKSVKVTGTLDKASNVIHVQTIQDVA